MVIKQKKFQNDIGRDCLFVLMLFIVVMFISCGFFDSKVVEKEITKSPPVVEVPIVVPDTFITFDRSYPSATYNAGTRIQVIQVEGRKFVIASHYYGIAICPVKED
jgi:hypothetical protein